MCVGGVTIDNITEQIRLSAVSLGFTRESETVSNGTFIRENRKESFALTRALSPDLLT